MGKRKINEVVFKFDHLTSNIVDVLLEPVVHHFRTLTDKLTEELNHGLDVETLITYRPSYDLTHALHLPEPLEVQQDHEGGEQLQAFTEGAVDSQGLRQFTFAFGSRKVVILGVEPIEEVVLVSHLLVLGERLVLSLRDANGVQQKAVGVDVGCLHSGECTQHHADFGRLEQRHVLVDVPLCHVDVTLCEEAEKLREQVLLSHGQALVPVYHIIMQRNLRGNPVHLVLQLVGGECPRILEGLVRDTLFEKAHTSPFTNTPSTILPLRSLISL